MSSSTSDLQTLLSQLQSIISKLRYVKTGDLILSDDHNNQNYAIKTIYDILQILSQQSPAAPSEQYVPLDVLEPDIEFTVKYSDLLDEFQSAYGYQPSSIGMITGYSSLENDNCIAFYDRANMNGIYYCPRSGKVASHSFAPVYIDLANPVNMVTYMGLPYNIDCAIRLNLLNHEYYVVKSGGESIELASIPTELPNGVQSFVYLSKKGYTLFDVESIVSPIVVGCGLSSDNTSSYADIYMVNCEDGSVTKKSVPIPTPPEGVSNYGCTALTAVDTGSTIMVLIYIWPATSEVHGEYYYALDLSALESESCVKPDIPALGYTGNGYLSLGAFSCFPPDLSYVRPTLKSIIIDKLGLSIFYGQSILAYEANGSILPFMGYDSAALATGVYVSTYIIRDNNGTRIVNSSPIVSRGIASDVYYAEYQVKQKLIKIVSA